MIHHDGEASLEEPPAGSADLFLHIAGGGWGAARRQKTHNYAPGCWFSSDTTSAGI